MTALSDIGQERDAKMAPDRTKMPILKVEGLRTEFHTGAGVAAAVDGISFDVRDGEILAIVGESGSGKSVTALSIMGLVPNSREPAARTPKGERGHG